MKLKSIIILAITILVKTQILYSQNIESPSAKNKINIHNADNGRATFANDTMTKYLNGNVKIYHDSTYFFADTAIVKEDFLNAINNVSIVQNDTINIFCDTLTYFADSSMAYLKNRVLLKNNDKRLITNELTYDVHNKIARYNKGAVLKQKESTLKSGIGIYFVNDNLIHFYENVTITDKAFGLKSDSLDFDTKERIAYFKAPTFIIKDSAYIYCEAGYYNLKTRNASFEQNVQYKKDSTMSEAQRLEYNDSLRLYTLTGNAHFKDNESEAYADKIVKDELNKIITLEGNAFYKSKTQSARGEKLIYNEDKEAFVSTGRSTIIDKSIIITADFTEYSGKSEKGRAKGNVEFIDTSSNIILNAIDLTFDNSINYMLAYGDSVNYLLIRMVSDGDTTYLSADTLLSKNIIVETDTTETMRAYNNVKIYNKDYQAVADSLVNFPQDSIYVLYKKPVMWSEDTQITGDTINMTMKNKKLDKIYARNNGFIGNFIAGHLYNQIKGSRINISFENDSLRYMNVNGNAESIYHMEEDNKSLTGTVKTVCSSIDFDFKENKISNIKFHGDPKSNLTPIKKEISNPQVLEGFSWYGHIRPANKDDVYRETSDFPDEMKKEKNEPESLEKIEKIIKDK